MMKGSSKHKWLILTSVVFTTMTHHSLALTFGTLYLHMLDTYNEDRYITATVQSLFLGVSLSFSVIGGIFVSRCGIQRVALTGSILAPIGFLLSYFAKSIVFLDISIGIISAIGISCIHTSNNAALDHLFAGSRKKVISYLQFAAICVAGIFYPYLMRWLVHTFGLRGTYLILGGILLHSFPTAIFIANDESINPKAKTSEQLYDEKGVKNRLLQISDEKVHKLTCSTGISGVFLKLKRVLKRLLTKAVVFVLLATASLVALLESNNLVIIDIFVTKGFSRAEGLVSYIPFSVFGFIARVLPVIFKMKKEIYNVLILPIMYSLCGLIGQLLIYASSNYIILLIGCSLSGISNGGVISASSIFMKTLGKRKFAVGSDLLDIMEGILIIVIGPLFGALRDATGSYDIIQLTTAGIQLMAMVLFILALIYRRREVIATEFERRREKIENEIDKRKEIIETEIDRKREIIENEIDKKRKQLEAKIDRRREIIETKLKGVGPKSNGSLDSGPDYLDNRYNRKKDIGIVSKSNGSL